jgi:hypothetical protein
VDLAHRSLDQPPSLAARTTRNRGGRLIPSFPSGPSGPCGAAGPAAPVWPGSPLFPFRPWHLSHHSHRAARLSRSRRDRSIWLCGSPETAADVRHPLRFPDPGPPVPYEATALRCLWKTLAQTLSGIVFFRRHRAFGGCAIASSHA